ncbi:flavodoxin [Bifidobacterium dolichotidis]|uniref:Flavodoxin n=1 Tax=Bifidobacterium dolichotidis TaxID=2306976 RepID=A0A430FPS1_9BIFI|nr:flavodoxin [Bifidobacterium dolichotidis]RSX54794.1 flavodoxin [Bifidobacterium dolichotidis]
MANTLVAYFSLTGHTRRVAEKLARITGADLVEIKPAVPYTKEDLDWTNPESRSSIEKTNEATRPAMAQPIDTTGYSTVFIGYPLWWETAPRIIRTFLESQDFEGVHVANFVTSSSSTRGSDGHRLHRSAPNALWHKGRRFTETNTEEDLRDWLDEMTPELPLD